MGIIIIGYILSALFFVLSCFVFVPLVPIIPLMFICATAFALADRFIHVTPLELMALSLLFVISIIVDYSSGIVGARVGGALRYSILFGIAGFVLGFLLLPPLGGFLGLFFGILFSEYVTHNNGGRALKAAGGSLIGIVGGLVINTIIAFTFSTLFLIFLF
jgi:uncharacterized protein YqgC (DUF456 family)